MALTGRKRRLDDEELRIKLAVADEGAAAAEPLVADRAILAAYSSCVRGLPSKQDEWDISQFLIEGQPAQRQVVAAWLNAAYSQLLDEPFDQDVEPDTSVTGLSQLLALADAVGSSRGLLRACLSQLGALCASVSVPEAHAPADTVLQVELSMDSEYHWIDDRTALVKLLSDEEILEVSSAEGAAVVTQQVAVQIEQLLFLAHKLQLPALQQKLHAFMSLNVSAINSLLYGSLGHVMTDRVLGAVTNENLSRQLAISSMITLQGGLTQHRHAPQLLLPLDLTPEQQVPVIFNAQLTCDAFGLATGDAVAVELDLFGPEPCIHINSVPYVAQLLVGTHVWDEQSLQAVMGPAPAAAAEPPAEA